MDRVEIYLKGKMLARGHTMRPGIYFCGLVYRDALEFASEVYTVYAKRMSSYSEASRKVFQEL